MKFLIVPLFSTLVLLSGTAFAKEFHFVVLMGRDTFEYKTKADTWEEAYAREAHSCFNFFVDRAGPNMSEDRGLDIIDACANPREKK